MNIALGPSGQGTRRQGGGRRRGADVFGDLGLKHLKHDFSVLAQNSI